jgi:pyridoxamine 5'-phosphate oxidase
MRRMAERDLAGIRSDYARARLDEAETSADPHELFRRWLDEALAAKVPEPTAMNLATLGPGGLPRSRIVLLKGVDERGLVFFTNYEGDKGRELAADPRCAVTFFWPELERQVRFEGRAERTSDEESATYFASRPRKSQLAAWASPQSRRITREELEGLYRDCEARYPEGPPVPRPPFWGGFRVVPTYVEFWQGRRSRMHDRVVYQGHGRSWARQRLAP